MSDVADSIRAALDGLGSAPDEVAEHLHALGVKGRRGDGGGCPIRQFLLHEFAEVRGWVCRDRVELFGVDSDVQLGDLPLPEPVQGFVAAFDDDGAYPELVDWPAPAERTGGAA